MARDRSTWYVFVSLFFSLSFYLHALLVSVLSHLINMKEGSELMIDMKLRLVLESSIVGLTSKPAQSTQISDITCPFELSEQSV